MAEKFDEIVRADDEDRFIDQSDFICLPEPVVVKGNGNATLFGLNNHFEETFPDIFNGKLAPEEYRTTINKVNSILRRVLPVSFKWLFCGCVSCCCTLGCSFWPVVCLNKRTKSSICKVLDWENQRLYHKLGLHWALAKQTNSAHGMTEYVLVVSFMKKAPIFKPD